MVISTAEMDPAANFPPYSLRIYLQKIKIISVAMHLIAILEFRDAYSLEVFILYQFIYPLLPSLALKRKKKY